jgi:hypothetical protein
METQPTQLLDDACALACSWADSENPPSMTLASTVGAVLGRDHVAWILRQPYPSCTASSRSAGAWDANLLAQCSAYHTLAQFLEGK